MGIVNLMDDNNKIIPNLRADLMRKSMENKNLLSHKGSLYVGTGRSETGYRKDGTNISVPITEELRSGEINTVLTTTSSNQGYTYKKISPDMVIKNQAYDIRCAEAEDTDYALYAGYATYASSDTSKGAIEDRLTRAETVEISRCSITSNGVSSDFLEGTVSVNSLYKRGGGVTMNLSIYNCYLSERKINGVWVKDTLTIQVPERFRPKYSTPISIGVVHYYAYSGSEAVDIGDVWSDITWAGTMGPVCKEITTYLSSNGTIQLSYDDSSNGGVVRGIEIYAGWYTNQ